jgi:Fusaric acid resistance protein-like
MLNVDRAWRAAVGYLPIVATVLTLAPIAGLAHIGIGIVVLGAAVCLTGRQRGERRDRTYRAGADVVVRALATTVGVSVLAFTFSRSLVAGDVLFIVVLLLARLAGRYGPRWAALGRALLLPLTALFIAPPVAVGHSPLESLAWAALACLIASVWIVVIAMVLPAPRPRVAAVARTARRAAASPPGRGRTRQLRALGAAALELDRKLAGDPTARAALFDVEYTVDRIHNGSAGTVELAEASNRLTDAVAVAQPAPDEAEPVDPRDAPTSRARSMLALNSALSVMLAFIAGQTMFPEHWPWTVITVITVGLGARSRGEVVLKSGQRLLGALVATAVATPLAALLAGQRSVMVAVILVTLGLGLYLRELSYIWWAIAITTVLAFLYGLLGQTGGGALLGQRLVAICVGALCAVGPALLLAPRSRDLVRKRTATCLRRLRDFLDPQSTPDLLAMRRLDAAVADLRTVAAPLQLVRQLRRTPETGWADTLAGCAAPTRALLAESQPTTVDGLRRTLAQVAQEVRATSRGAQTGATR